MATTINDRVLSEAFGANEGAAHWIRHAVLVLAGIALLAVAAKVRVLVPPSPVPVNLGTFAVLTIGAAYGPRLGLATILGYMIISALGFDIFANSTAETNGIAYMMGGTGGYLLGYVLATMALGLLARRGWDRSVLLMGAAMLIGNALIYVPGLLWLNQFTADWEQTFAWGFTPFVIGDGLKLALAALLLPAAWKMVGAARG